MPHAAPSPRREGADKRALITGLAGFTGYYMALELAAAGYRVFGTVMPGTRFDQAASGVDAQDVFAVDLCDAAAVAAVVGQVRPDVVLHLAGIAFVAHANVDLMYAVNVVGSRNLLAALAASAHRPGAVLLASSANIYGNADVAVIDESVAPAPANDYAVSKLAMEYMARLWMDRLPIILARPFNYTGVGQAENFLLPKIVSHFRRGAREIELGNLAIARDFSDVRSVVRSYRALVAAAPAALGPNPAFNVCSGHSTSLRSVVAMMEEIAGYKIEVRVNPAFVRSNDVLTLTGSRAKLDQVIGAVEQCTLADTLRWMYRA
ncbi:GDP-mannose 4,6-dehydratase [Massilia sp. S19_KUP03_FR1]|uniref:GDP-mannose 4,6-dehydratase n=1 Tax=Massilia sp. S19_KUP03_FR1 TaxID=3025503 RepID=UPI002FCDB7A6